MSSFLISAAVVDFALLSIPIIDVVVVVSTVVGFATHSEKVLKRFSFEICSCTCSFYMF